MNRQRSVDGFSYLLIVSVAPTEDLAVLAHRCANENNYVRELFQNVRERIIGGPNSGLAGGGGEGLPKSI